MSSQFKRLTKVLAKSLDLGEADINASFRLANRDDIATVSALRRKVFGGFIKQDDPIYLEWRYFGRKEYPSTLWVFIYEEKIIAALGTEPVEIWIEDHLEPALKNMDAIVEPKFDSRGLGAWMTLAIQDRYDFVLVNGGNKKSTSMLKKLFTALPIKKNYKIILNAGDFLDQKFTNSHLNNIVKPMINLFTSVYLNIRWLFKSVPDNLSLKYLSVSQLLCYIEHPVGCIGDIKVVRTQSYLKWRYVDNPCTDYYTIALFDGDRLVAYVIYKYEDGWGNGSTRMGQIVDWYIYQSIHSLSILTSLFIAAIKDLKIKGADEVMMVLNDNLSHQAASSAGFIYRYVESTFFVYHENSSEKDHIFSQDAWYQSLGDTDTV